MKLQAIRLSHGELKTKQLRRLAKQVNRGRGLYSQASPVPPMNPGILNLQTGRLARSWQTRLTFQADGTQVTLFNTARYAKFMLGTVKMIARPILEEVIHLEKDARLRRLWMAKTGALKGEE